MVLEHRTSIVRAWCIVNSGCFKGFSDNPLNGDAGMNCLNGSLANKYADYGVTMRFIWSGPPPIKGGARPYGENELHDEGAWRLVVSLGTNKYLEFSSIKIECEERVNSDIASITPWYKKFRRYWIRAEKLRLLKSFRAMKRKKITIQ